MDGLTEDSNEESLVGDICEVMGEDIPYLALIHQLLVCEDSMHATNGGAVPPAGRAPPIEVA